MTNPVVTDNLGTVQVWTGKAATSFSCFVSRYRGQLRLRDHEGKYLTPKSARLGFNGRRPGKSYAIICDDDSVEHLAALVESGYMNVQPRG